MTTEKRLRSECRRYFAERVGGDSPWYRLYDADGNLLGQTVYWSNKSTKSRISFETGLGEHRPIFSRPRYPRLFRRRWVCCFDLWIDDLAKLAESFGCLVVTGWKGDMSIWCNLGVIATSEQIAMLDEELASRGVKFNGPPRKDGQWDIDYSERGHREALEKLNATRPDGAESRQDSQTPSQPTA